MIEGIIALVFVSVAGLTWSVYSATEKAINKHRLQLRLREEKTNSEDGRFDPGGFGLLVQFGKKLRPRSQTERDTLRRRLDRAGIRAYYALDLYYGIRASCALVVGVGVFLFLVWWRSLSGQTIVISYVALMTGYYAPVWWLKWREKEQVRHIINELPDALDILLVCMHAGLSFDRALLRVGRELRYVAPVLAREFERYFYEVESGLPRQEALQNLARRNQVDALTSIVNVLLQSVRFGTDIAQALRIHADGLRVERRQLAEEKAAKVSTKLVIPTVIFIMPALILVVLGPASIRLLERLRNISW